MTGAQHSILLPPRLFPDVSYYVALASAPCAVVDTSLRYDKRCKAVHRYEITDTRGRVQLTVPLAKPHDCPSAPTWADAIVSTHDRWWLRQRTTLESAYGRTPYFEFMIDKFAAVFRSPEDWPVWPTALDVARTADEIVRIILDIRTDVEWRAVSPADAASATDMRRGYPQAQLPPYWQIREAEHGFVPSLSILDLIFNLGPDAILYIDRAVNNLKHER